VFCIRGELEYDVKGSSYHLKSGDALLFSSTLEHKWRNPGSKVTNALIVLSGFQGTESPSKYHLTASSTESDPD
jgi:mannose-6-phosphate isomerase-like protein (cupin superfamily)